MAFFVVLFVCAAISNSAFAKENDTNNENPKKSTQNEQKYVLGWTEEKVNKRLKDLGLSDEQIGDLNWESKIEIVKEEKAKSVLSFSKSSYNFNDKTGTINEISPMSLTSDLNLSTVAIDLGKKNGHPYIKIVSDYDWKKMPFYRLWDGFAITWSEGWYGNSWGFTDKQKVASYCNEYTGCTYQWKSTSHYNATDEDRLSGVGWKYDLKSAAVDAKGTAYVYLIGNDESRIKSTNYSAFKTWYGHDEWLSNLEISIGLPKGAGIAASVSFGGEKYTTDSTSIYNPSLSY
jgi:hypothetical protein